MKKTVVIYGSTTGTLQAIAENIAEKLGVEAIDVANLDSQVIADHDNLLLGTKSEAKRS